MYNNSQQQYNDNEYYMNDKLEQVNQANEIQPDVNIEQQNPDEIYQQQNLNSEQVDYYGNVNKYNVDYISENEGDYTQYNNEDYYAQYYQNQSYTGTPNEQLHQQYKEYFYANYDLMKESFPKKRKISRWEKAAEEYSSLDDNGDFSSLLNDINAVPEVKNKDVDYEDTIVETNNSNNYTY